MQMPAPLPNLGLLNAAVVVAALQVLHVDIYDLYSCLASCGVPGRLQSRCRLTEFRNPSPGRAGLLSNMPDDRDADPAVSTLGCAAAGDKKRPPVGACSAHLPQPR